MELPRTQLDSAAWRIATWSVPVMMQFVLVLYLATTWAAGNWLLTGQSYRTIVLIGAATSAVLVLMPSLALLGADSSRARGVGVAVAGSDAAALVGLVVAAFWIYQ